MCRKAHVHDNVILEPTLHMMWLNCRVVVSEIFSGQDHLRPRLRDL